MELSIFRFKGSPISVSMEGCVSVQANSAVPDEMPPYAAFHLGLHCLPNYMSTHIPNEKG